MFMRYFDTKYQTIMCPFFGELVHDLTEIKTTFGCSRKQTTIASMFSLVLLPRKGIAYIIIYERDNFQKHGLINHLNIFSVYTIHHR